MVLMNNLFGREASLNDEEMREEMREADCEE
jgi:hypothetical protein